MLGQQSLPPPPMLRWRRNGKQRAAGSESALSNAIGHCCPLLVGRTHPRGKGVRRKANVFASNLLSKLAHIGNNFELFK
jgi:hypothetical protein